MGAASCCGAEAAGGRLDMRSHMTRGRMARTMHCVEEVLGGVAQIFITHLLCVTLRGGRRA